MSVGTFEAFFGHDTQTAAAGAMRPRRVSSRFFRSARLLTNTCTTSTAADTAASKRTPSGSGASQSR